MASQPEMTLLARPGVINVTLKGVQKFLEGLWVGPLCQSATLCHYRKSHNWMDGATAETRRKEMLWAAAARASGIGKMSRRSAAPKMTTQHWAAQKSIEVTLLSVEKWVAVFEPLQTSFIAH